MCGCVSQQSAKQSQLRYSISKMPHGLHNKMASCPWLCQVKADKPTVAKIDKMKHKTYIQHIYKHKKIWKIAQEVTITSYKLQVTSYKLQVTSNLQQATQVKNNTPLKSQVSM